jgi:phosphatidylinositol alpha-1,6-mannosyltransferase
MRKNVLYIYHNGNAYGGGDESLLALLSRLDRNRFNPYVLCTSGGVFTDKLKELGIEFKVIDKDYLERIGRLRLLFLLIRLTIFIKKSKIKLIHINSLGRLHYLTLLCKLMGIRSVYHLRSLLVTRRICGRDRFVMNLSDKIIAHCEHMRKTAIEIGLVKDKICVIYNGVDLNKFNPGISATKFRKEVGIDDNIHLVGMVGRVVPWKGADVFIRAGAEVIKKIPNTKFVVVGELPDSQYLEHLVKLAEVLGVKDKLLYTGLRSNMAEVFSAIDLFILPSWEEPFSRVVLEAMAQQKPVVATNTGGTPEQVVDGVTGLLVPAKNSASLAEAIIRLLRDKKKAKEMGIAGRKRVEQFFSLEKQTREIESVYWNLMEHPKILIYSHEFPPFGSGAGNYCYQLAKGLARLNQNVIVLTTKYVEESAREWESYPFRIVRVKRTGGLKERLLSVPVFVYLMYRFRPHQILIVEKWAQEVASLIRLIIPFKYSVTVHGSEVLTNAERKKRGIKSRLLSQILIRFYRKAYRIIAVSNYTRNLLVEMELPVDKIAVIPNGIDIERFSQPANSGRLRDRLGLDGEDKVLLTLAMLKPRKGQDMVIKALSLVIEKLPNVKYLIAGFGEDRKRLQDLVIRYGLQQHTFFTGYVPQKEILDFYDLCDVFVMPSRQDGPRVEGFGIPFLEANARGKPVIGGNHGGVPEVIINNETGILVNPYSVEEIAEAIIKLLSQKELARRMGEKGRQRCFRYFNWETLAERTLNFLSI